MGKVSPENNSREIVINYLKEEFINYSDFELNGVNLDTDLDEIGLDSLDLIEIAMDLEHEFTIDISDNEVSTWNKVEDIINCTLNKMEN